MTTLDPGGLPVTVGAVTLRTPGLQGEATAHQPGTEGMRAAELSTAELDAALQEAGAETLQTIELEGTLEVDVGAVPTRSTSFGEPAIEVTVPDPGDAFGQVVLSIDEAGVTTWNLARDDSLAVDVTRGAAARTYVVRRYVPTTPSGAEVRGLIGAIGKKILKVVVFPLLDPLVGAVGEYFVKRWENAKRPYAIRAFGPDDHGDETAPAIDGPGWERLSAGRALLMVHGTFSRASAAFGSIPAQDVSALGGLYGGRVFAFDHPTLSVDPRHNAEWFLSQVPDGTSLDVDIVCHSRGGLVARSLAEKQAAFSLGSRTLRVGKIVFAAAPNDGTPLADTKYMNDFIDSYTTILNLFPDNGVTFVLEGIVAVLKQLAVDTVKGLDGLQSMVKAGDFLHGWLNSGPAGDERYFALAANYEPVNPGLAAYAADRLLDAIFKVGNDLVVPTTSPYEANGAGLFPIEDRLEFGPADGVMHSGYFANATARRQIMDWLAS